MNDIQTSVFANNEVEFQLQPENEQIYPFILERSDLFSEVVTENDSDEDYFSGSFFNINAVDSATDKSADKRKETNFLKTFFLKKAINKLNEIIEKDASYFAQEEIELPNESTINKSLQLLFLLAEKSIFPNKISTSIEEGICLTFKRNDLVLYLEIYNTGEIGYLVENVSTNTIVNNEDVESLETMSFFITDFFNQNAFSEITL